MFWKNRFQAFSPLAWVFKKRGMGRVAWASALVLFQLSNAWSPKALPGTKTLPGKLKTQSHSPQGILSRAIPGNFVAPQLPPGIHWNSTFQTPAFIEGDALRKMAEPGIHAKLSRVNVSAMDFFNKNRETFRLKNPAEELHLKQSSIDKLGFRHEGYQQMFQGIPVWGGEINAHFDAKGSLYALNAAYAPTPQFKKAPKWKLVSQSAIAAALLDLKKDRVIEDLNTETRALLEYAGPIAERTIWRDSETSEAYMAWRVEIRPNMIEWWRYFIHAETGEILEKYDASNSDGPKTATARDLSGANQTINTYQVGNNYYLIDGTRKSFNPQSTLPGNPKGALWTMTAANTDLVRVSQVTSTNNTWNDASAVSAHHNLAKVYEYYFNTFNRLGIDGAGGTMISVVHVTQNGAAMDNAYWNGKLMAYGDGSRNFKSLSGALDVTGHELTHGIISATVNLEYKNQSGALNESLADVFGAMIDADDWKIGEDVIIASRFPSGALRSMEDPHNGGSSSRDASWQPAHMLEFVKLSVSSDNGGVHINSGIPNHACYLMAKAIGREKTAQIYYRVLDARYLNSRSQFMDMRLGAVRAATDLYGAESPEVAGVRDAFTAVGIGNANSSDIPTPRPEDRDPAPGDQYLVMIHAKAGDSSIYTAKSSFASSTEITQISKTQIYSGSGKPLSISRNGQTILFIDKFYALRSLDASGEHLLDSSTQWKSVAISPDGKRAALTTLKPDAQIHLLELQPFGQKRSLELYTPTTGQETQSNTVVYADALEFNSSGESLVFDALNRVTLSSGTPIEFWTASLVEIESGIITPFLPSLPDGVSIGNPSFAQTNDLNVVFDLIDEYTGTFSLVAADLFTGAFKVLDSNGTVPFGPRYSTRDDQILFTRANAGVLNVYRLPMAKDKITPTGKAIAVASEFQKPIWYAKSAPTFNLPTTQSAAGEIQFQTHQAGRYSLHLPSPSQVRIQVYDAFGRNLGECLNRSLPAGEFEFPWSAPAGSGLYWLRLEALDASGAGRILTRKVFR